MRRRAETHPRAAFSTGRRPPRAMENERATAPQIEFDARFRPGSLAWVAPGPSPAVEDRLVRAAFHHLVRNGTLGPVRARELGRALGREARPGELAAHLDAFAHLGLGDLRILSEEPGRCAFAGRDLLESAAGPNAASCALALGYAEGLVEGLHGKRALGSEMTCRSRGHAECTFVVMAR